MKYLNYIFIALLTLFCSSCWTILPPGDAPEGPIIKDPENSETTIISPEKAVNRMITSLVMKCPAIATAGKEKPKVTYEFVISDDKVKNLQNQVWIKLMNMKMIKPITGKRETPVYLLGSKIVRLPQKVNGKIKYSWIMSMQKIADKKEIWREELEFCE